MKINNKLEYYLSLPYKLIITPDTEEGGYVAEYPELPGCVTFADNMDELISLAGDAKKSWIESALENNILIPEPFSESYSGQFKLRIPKSLHRQLALHSKEEGISMNQYCLYLLSMNDAIKTSRI